MTKHGERQSYLAGCHCPECTKADRDYMEGWRAGRTGKISIAARSRAQGWAIAWMIRNEHPRWVEMLERAKKEVTAEFDAKERESAAVAATTVSEVSP